MRSAQFRNNAHHRSHKENPASCPAGSRCADPLHALWLSRLAIPMDSALAERFNVPQSQVTWAECIFHWNENGEAMLTADPESLEGLSLTGALSQGLACCLTG